MKIAVIIADANHAIHVGGEVQRKVRVFELPDEIAAYITAGKASEYHSVSLAVVDEHGEG